MESEVKQEAQEEKVSRFAGSGRKILAGGFKAAIAVAVLVFLAMHSIRLFSELFPAEQQTYAFLGFGLTGVAAVGYLILFMWDADTALKGVTSLVMTGVSFAGEILTAYFGMQIEAWKKNGWVFTQTDMQMALQVVTLLAFLQAIALVIYFAGDLIGELFSGVKLPTFGRGKKNATLSKPVQTTALASETEQVKINPNGEHAETAANFTKGER